MQVVEIINKSRNEEKALWFDFRGFIWNISQCRSQPELDRTK